MGEQPRVRRSDEILERLMAGELPAEIASALSMSPFTLANHLADLRERYGARTTAQLVARAWSARAKLVAEDLLACRRALAVLDRRGRGS